MSSKNNLYVSDRRYGRSGRSGRKRQPSRSPFLSIALLLVAATLVVALFRYGPELFSAGPAESSGPASSDGTNPAGQTGQTGQTTPAASDTTAATPAPTAAPAAYNPQLLPVEDYPVLTPGTPDAACSPQERNIVATIFDAQYKILASFSRPNPISLIKPLTYNQIPGVLTFRGNNFRNAPAFGQVSLQEKKMTQVWQKAIGSMKSSSWSFSWTGTGWTGQPLLVQWSAEVRSVMNIKPEKKSKENLIEVIYATMDGNVYFLDLDDGQPTRDPINIGATIKGTPCVDPRGYPVLYVGQGDENGTAKGIGFRVFNLIDQSLLLFRECSDSNSYRANWGACDSSPIFDAAADTLIYPNENGLIYTAKMNTQFDAAKGTLSINPEFTTYRYKMTGMEKFGIESSLAVYDHYGYSSDNSGILNCVDINTLQPIWSRQLEDDSDVTPVLCQNESELALYTGTEVDWQKDIVGNYKGSAFVYKIDAMTGKILWETSYDCWTKNAANNGDDVNGGTMGTPVVGKKDLKGLVIFSFCMTNGTYSGNSVVAFNQKDGSVAWEYKMDQYSWSSPVDIYDENGHGYILIPDSIGQIHLVDGLTGKAVTVLQLTRGDAAEAAGNIESSCAVFNNRLVIGTRGGVIIGVELK